MEGIVAYALLNKKVKALASGISNIVSITNGLRFTTTSGSNIDVTLPTHTHTNLANILEKFTLDGNNELLFDGQSISNSSIDLTNYYTKSEVDNLLSTSSGNTTSAINVLGVTQGAYSNGNVIASGTSLELIIKNMLTTIIPPTYTSPTLSIVGSGSLSIEAGTSITPVITATFSQNDSGISTNYIVKKNGVSVYTNPTPNVFTSTAFTIGDETIAYQSTVDYNAGAIKNDNASNPYPTGQILAGTKTSNTVSYIGKRNLFYGTNTTNTVPTISSEVRAMTNKTLGVANGGTFTINIPIGAKIVYFAYPSTLQDVTSIKYVEGLGAEVKGNFAKTNIMVEGSNAFASISYKVYCYMPASAFTATATYNVII